MQTVSIKDLRNNLAQIIEEVAIAKKHIEVTKFGKSKVALVPIEEVKKRVKKEKKIDLEKLPAFGMWKDRKDMKDPAKWVAELRKRESLRLFSK